MNTAKKKPSVRKILLIIASTVAALAIIVISAGYLYLNSKLSNVHYVSTPGSSASTQAAGTSTTSGEQLPAVSGIYNVLLIGSDTRNPDGNGRSDSMILVSLNSKTKKVVMVSFMRDMYVSIPGHGKTRINAAYAYGGADLLIQTIESNFKIQIDNYAAVDFYSFIKIIDAVGGVTISVTQDELPVLNNYVKEINHLEGLSADDGILKSAGNDLLLTGKQALGYSRIRYVGNADFQRTERQRTVLNAVIKKLKKQNLLQLNSVLDTLLPNVTTNIPKSKLMSLSLNALTYLNYDVSQDRIPINGGFNYAKIDGMSVLTIDFVKNQAELQKVIYGK